MRLATANLLSGRGFGTHGPDGSVAPAAGITAALATLAPDVLAVQEVDRGIARTGHVDQAVAAAAALPDASWRFVRTVGRPTHDGDYGIALATRLPVLEWHELRLPGAPGRYPLPVPGNLLWIADEPRAAVAAVVQTDGGRLTVAATHLSFVVGMNVLQLRQVRRWLDALPGPRVLLGDLNLPPGPASRLTGYTPLFRGPTFPSPAPRVQLDNVLADRALAVRAAEAVRLPFSDHRAVTVDVDVR
ncbi:endonuclease/exonuclease/phosphatase family protein [Spongisporangium articulatum]|uniref:Endonuclease/exonuclease/phosphatase family protein n=1 Tax=Spongisporangium articulatum TaxID=3362603 RepID=A0ABW8ARS4_9ACTN